MLFGRIGRPSYEPCCASTAAVALTVGLLVTSRRPVRRARRAGRVSPVAAMRDDVALAESGLRWRIVVGCLLLRGRSPAWPRPGGRRLGTDLRPGRRHVRRPRRDRAAEPRARPAGVAGTRLALPPRLCTVGLMSRTPGGTPADSRDGIRPDDRCRAGDDDGRARGVGQGEPRPDPRRGHRRRLRRGGMPWGTATIALDVEALPGSPRWHGSEGSGPRSTGPGLRVRGGAAAFTSVASTDVVTGSLGGPGRRLGRHPRRSCRARGCRSAPP